MKAETMYYEKLVGWAREVWQSRHPGKSAVTIWASSECSNHIAQKQVKPGRRLRAKFRYDGLDPLECPFIVPISDYGTRGQSYGANGKRWGICVQVHAQRGSGV